MTWLDRYLQSWRIREARRELPPGARVLDIGTHDGTLFCLTRAGGVGIDPELAAAASIPGVTLVKGSFPEDLPQLPDESFNAVTALAVIEHVPESELLVWAETIARLVVPSGPLIITVPAPAVDTILHVLMRLHLVAGMAAHQHHRFQLEHPGPHLHRSAVAASQTPHVPAGPEPSLRLRTLPEPASPEPSAAPSPSGQPSRQLSNPRFRIGGGSDARRRS